LLLLRFERLLQLVRHLVEGAGEVAELIARGVGDPRVPVARRQPLNRDTENRRSWLWSSNTIVRLAISASAPPNTNRYCLARHSASSSHDCSARGGSTISQATGCPALSWRR
jgi:hypothetical protein